MNLPEMNTSDIIEKFSKLKYSFRKKIQLATQRSDFSTGESILRIEQPIFNIDPLKWLHRQKYNPKMYWSERDHGFEMAGIGSADMISGDAVGQNTGVFSKMAPVLKNGGHGLRYFGGFRFDQNGQQDSIWKYFGSFWFFIPKLEIIRQNGKTKLVLNIRTNARSDSSNDLVEEAIAGIEHESEQGLENEVKVKSRLNMPSKTDWLQNIERTMKMFDKDQLKKIVLARRSTLDIAGAIDATHIMALMKLKSANTFDFCFQPSKEIAFMGRSPELLYRREGNEIVSEAIAGTRPRGKDEACDQRLANDLLGSTKDIREHALVCQWIEKALMRLCNSHESDYSVQVLKSSHVQHLYKQYRGVLNERDDAGIISMLHPTPAVAGVPQEKCLQRIRTLERFDRGWYAGPVGWVGSNSAEFAVGIRSALMDQNMLHLYSGAGILPDSDAEQEWQELEHKISHYINLFP